MQFELDVLDVIPDEFDSAQLVLLVVRDTEVPEFVALQLLLLLLLLLLLRLLLLLLLLRLLLLRMLLLSGVLHLL